MELKFFFYLLFSFLIKCSLSQNDRQTQGVVNIKRYLYESDTTMEISFRILYKNRQSIQEVPQLNMREDSSGTWFFTKILHYSYLDPEKNVCFNYRNFSATSSIIYSYNAIDSVKIDGGWNFYTDQQYEYDAIKSISDTVIYNIDYKRVRVDKNINDSKSYFDIYFFRCDKKDALINFNKSLGEKIGCPATKVETWRGNNLVTSVEIQFLSDTLSENELRIFKVWDQNTRK